MDAPSGESLERFNLEMHNETRQLPIYSLMVTKSGSKLQPTHLPGGTSSGPKLLRGTMDTAAIARNLTSALGRTVIDNTGLKDSYNFSLTWATDDHRTALRFSWQYRSNSASNWNRPKGLFRYSLSIAPCCRHQIESVHR
jgi:uncharacterized protein (TIGR03435 family)